MINEDPAKVEVSGTVSSLFELLVLVADNRVLQRLVFCTGQIYYELLAEREERGDTTTALVRLEQIAPFAFDRVAQNCKKYPNAEVIWAQQEPK